ncbi:MAG: hypothetical protein PHW95_02595 [Patescibacteria group bacterium]|nr:hypothetical protein [Patescibacteria group bacterium]
MEKKNEFDITLTEARNIMADFGKCIQDHPGGGYQNLLPHSTDSILIAALKIILSDETDKVYKEIASLSLVYLKDFIPDEKEYKKMVFLKESKDILMDESISLEERAAKMSRIRKKYL